MKKRKKNNIKYSAILILLSLFLFAAISLRIVYLATSKEVDGKNLQELASRRTTKQDTIYATRGSIYASNGDLLAQNVSSYKLIVSKLVKYDVSNSQKVSSSKISFLPPWAQNTIIKG